MSLRPAAARALIATGVAMLVVAPLSAPLAGAAATRGAHTSWTSQPLPAAKGTGLARNEDGEPGMGVTPSGQFWIASDIAPYAAHDPRVDPLAGLLSGADVWTSTDGGKSYRWVADPFAEANNSFGLAGEDTDLAVATAKNSNGFYNVYATSLWVGDSGLAWSADGGKTWSLNRLGGTPTQDRPWLAADGACTVYLGFHQLPSFTPTFDTYDVCSNGNVPTSTGAALDPVHETELSASDFPGLSGSFNKFIVDTSPHSKWRHSVYQPMTVCQVQDPTDLVTNAVGSNCPKGTQYILAVSRDGGQTFTYHKVVLDPSGTTLVWAATVGADAAGKLYFAWSDSKNVYLDMSSDGGTTWTKPVKLNPAGTAAVYPTVAGGAAGRVDIAWYGADRAGNSNDPKKMGMASKPGSATWRVDLARSTDGGSHFDVNAVTDVIHRGELCTHGSGCGDTNSRNLLDDFGLAIDPTTGRTSIAYTADTPQGQAATAYTAFASELAPRTAKHGVKHVMETSHAQAAGGGVLPATGAPAGLALAGSALVLAGLRLRRRVTA